MFLKSLKLVNFRNFKNFDIEPGRGINLIVGENGSGKTALLESIYYLSLARSFRTSNHNAIINFDSKEFFLNAKLFDNNEPDKIHVLGLSRDSYGKILAKLDGSYISKISVLASNICIQFLSPSSFDLLDGSPSNRREFIDWGCFYHFENYSFYFQQYKQVLKQRNALLQQKKSNEEILFWTKKFIEISLIINSFREKYLEIFNEKVKKIFEYFFSNLELQISLTPGFKTTVNDFTQQLNDSFSKEIMFGYSLFGPHKSDLKIKINGKNVVDIFSRGQQKLLVIALRISQGLIYEEIIQNNCIFLIDDLTSELDKNAQNKLFSYIKNFLNNSQFFITLLSDSYANEINVNQNCKIFRLNK